MAAIAFALRITGSTDNKTAQRLRAQALALQEACTAADLEVRGGGVDVQLDDTPAAVVAQVVRDKAVAEDQAAADAVAAVDDQARRDKAAAEDAVKAAAIKADAAKVAPVKAPKVSSVKAPKAKATPKKKR